MQALQGKKVLLLCVKSNNITEFRKDLIKKLQGMGNHIAAIAFDDDWKEKIAKQDVDFFCIADKNRGLNPFKLLSLQKKYLKIVKQVQPDIVFTFMMKPNIFGVKAARKARVRNIYSMVEGAGDVFINNSLKWKAIRWLVCRLYKSSFKYSRKVFFLNQDDQEEFVSRGLVKVSQCEMVHGIGVDITKFEQKPIKNSRIFLMIARMLTTKGIFEYCEAARAVKRQYPDAQFQYVGGEGTVTVADIQEYIDDGTIQYFGQTNDVRPYLENCGVYVLPSYREGMPVSVMEAASTGRAIITNEVAGCRETVKNGYNGFLVRDRQELTEKMCYFLRHPEQVEKMGANSRIFAQEHFDQCVINEKICKIIEREYEN